MGDRKKHPLSGGNLAGIEYENGGGYNIRFGGDRYVQYHPEEYSHHEGAYYKTSRGKEGIKHYDLHGNEKQ